MNDYGFNYYNQLFQQAAARGQKPKDKGSWIEPALTTAGAVVGSVVPGVGTAAGAAAGKALGSAAHSMANGAGPEAMLMPGMNAAQTFMPSAPQTAITPQATQPNPPLPDPFADPSQVNYNPYDWQQQQSPWWMPRGYNAGGPVPGGQMPWWVRAGATQADPQAVLNQFGGPEPTPFVPQQPSHPTLEMLASVIPQVLNAMPKPANPKNTKAIGAWLPAMSAAISAPASYAQARREKANTQGQERYDAQEEARNKRMAAAAPQVAAAMFREPKEQQASKLERYQMPLEEPVRVGLGAPSWVKTYGHLDEWQQGRIASASADERAAKTESAQEEVERIAADIASFQTEPDVPLNGRSAQFGAAVKNRVNELLRANGSPYNYQQLRTMWTEKQNFNKTQNNQRFVQLRQSAVTVRKHLEQFKEFYRKFSKITTPSGIRTIGKARFQLALEGFLGDDAQRAASELAATSHAVAREAALVFSGGFAPLEKDMEAASDALNVASMGRSAGEGTISALERLIEARIKTATEGTPFAGGRSNPYLMDASPIGGWNDSAPTPSTVPDSGIDSGSARQGYFPKDAKPAVRGRR